MIIALALLKPSKKNLGLLESGGYILNQSTSAGWNFSYEQPKVRARFLIECETHEGSKPASKQWGLRCEENKRIKSDTAEKHREAYERPKRAETT